MKQPDVRVLLHDVEMAAARIERFIGDMTVSEYQENDLVRAAVERQFEICGEALGKAVKVRPELQDRISGLSRVVAFRNQLIHGYAAIDPAVVWAIARDHLPDLLSQIRSESARLDVEARKPPK